MAAERGRVRRIAAGLAVAAILVGLIAAGVWVAPRLDVPTEFRFAPIETVSVGGRELRVVRVGYNQGLRESATHGGAQQARPSQPAGEPPRGSGARWRRSCVTG